MCKKPIAEVKHPEKLKDDEGWIAEFDMEAFTADMKALGKKLEAEQGEEDVNHLEKMILWSNSFAAVGLISMGFSVNIITQFCISVYVFTRWAMIAHHTCHGGYDKCHPNSSRWHRFKFALGSTWRRWNDWFDWMMPEAWNVEHNTRHHYNLSEITDPDLAENNGEYIRGMDAPLWVKYIYLGVLMFIWKWFYYAPNTYKELKLARLRRFGKEIPKDCIPEDAVTIIALAKGATPFFTLWEFFAVVAGPYLIIHFFITPIPFYFLGEYLDSYTGKQMYMNAITNLFFADLMSNLHSFICIATNHAGDDMFRFSNPCTPYSGSFFLRQILASANYHHGPSVTKYTHLADLIDFMHGFLNYQAEHHMWPNLSMRSYQKAAPQVRVLCKKYGVPYTQQNVFWRTKKTADIFIGTASMRWFPLSYETQFIEADAMVAANKRK